jgi:2'-5' RNA ligase superfamily
MHCWPGPADRINSFALVSYIPGELGTFLDNLRRELVSDCLAQAHVSVLPPRLVESEEAAEASIAATLADVPAFILETTQIEVFESTSVIYLGLGEGRNELKRLHDLLNAGPLTFDEPFQYSPHLTLAQGFPLEEIDVLADCARRCWAEFRGPRSYLLDQLIFVQNTSRNSWVDLRRFTLAPAPTYSNISS